MTFTLVLLFPICLNIDIHPDPKPCYLDLAFSVKYNAGVAELYEQVDLADPEVIKQSLKSDLGLWLSHYSTYTACVVCALAYVLILPVVGCVIACCRCCGKCQQKNSMESKHGKCHRRMCTCMLFCMCTLCFVLIVTSFVCAGLAFQETFHEAGFTEVIKQSLQETDVFIEGVVQEFDSLYVNDFWPVYDEIVSGINTLPEDCEEFIGDTSDVVDLLKVLGVYLLGLNDTLSKCSLIQHERDYLIETSNALEQSIIELNKDMTSDLMNCSDPLCTEALQYMNALSLSANYTTLPTMNDTIDILLNVTHGPDSVYVLYNQSLDEFKSLSIIISTDADRTIEDLIKGFDALNSEFVSFLNLTVTALTSLDIKNAESTLNDNIQPWVEYVGMILFYVSLTLCILTLIVISFAYIGILIGSCFDMKQNRSQYSENSSINSQRNHNNCMTCHKGKASHFLLCSTIMIFVVGWISMTFLTLLFILGGVTHNDVCHTLVGGNNDVESMQTLDSIIRSRLEINISILNTANECQGDLAIYSAANIEQLGQGYNITHVFFLDRYKIPENLHLLTQLNYSVDNLQVFSDELKIQLLDIEKALHLIDFSSYYGILQDNITTINILDFSLYLHDAASEVSDTNISEIFLDYSNELELLHENYILPIQNSTESMTVILMDIELYINSFNISQFIHDATVADTSINSQEVRTAMDILTNSIYNDSMVLTISISNIISEETGQCFTIYSGYSNSVTSFCINFLFPFNAYWSCLGLCLILFIFLIIMMFQLSTLYSKTEKYSVPFPPFTRMSFHRHLSREHSSRMSSKHGRTNHGDDIQAELAMQRINDPRYNRTARIKNTKNVSVPLNVQSDDNIQSIDRYITPRTNDTTDDHNPSLSNIEMQVIRNVPKVSSNISSVSGVRNYAYLTAADENGYKSSEDTVSVDSKVSMVSDINYHSDFMKNNHIEQKQFATVSPGSERYYSGNQPGRNCPRTVSHLPYVDSCNPTETKRQPLNINIYKQEDQVFPNFTDIVYTSQVPTSDPATGSEIPGGSKTKSLSEPLYNTYRRHESKDRRSTKQTVQYEHQTSQGQQRSYGYQGKSNSCNDKNIVPLLLKGQQRQDVEPNNLLRQPNVITDHSVRQRIRSSDLPRRVITYPGSAVSTTDHSVRQNSQTSDLPRRIITYPGSAVSFNESLANDPGFMNEVYF